MFGIDLFDASLAPALFVALMAGMVSFLSPCVLPIVPPYIAYMSGMSIAEAGSARHRAILPALFFVLGLSTVFLFLGFTASWIGQAFLTNQVLLAQIAGVVIYVFGLHFIGLKRAPLVFALVLDGLVLIYALTALTLGEPVLAASLTRFKSILAELVVLLLVSLGAVQLPFNRIPFLDYEARFDAGDRGGSAFGAYLLGLAFAFGWTPCIGPLLGAILSLAASEASLARGTALLGVYALGLGLPFVLFAAFLDRAQRQMLALKRHMGLIEKIMGGLLVVVGLALLTGAFTAFSWWLLESFPGLATLG